MSDAELDPYQPPNAAPLESLPQTSRSRAFAVFRESPLALGLLALWLPVNFGIALALDAGDAANPAHQLRVTVFPHVFLDSFSAGLALAACECASRNESATIGRLFARSAGAWRRVFPAAFIAHLLTGLAMFAFVVPGLVFAVRYVFVEVVAFREGKASRAARVRSIALVVGRGWRMAGILGVFLLAQLLPTIPLEIARQLTSMPAALQTLIGVAQDTASDFVYAALFAVLWFEFDDAVDTRAARPSSSPSIIRGDPS